MEHVLLLKNRNYRLLFTSGIMTNLGDGMITLALPWLASLISRDPLAIAAVAAATRLPWLLFALPAGVIVDRVDHRKLMARADLFRAALLLGIMTLALSSPDPQAVWALVGMAFLLGSAEVLRDNAAQTLLPSIVETKDLEAANGQMWSAEQLTGQFIGPPLAGLLIGFGIAVPFGVDAGLMAGSAALIWLITLAPQVSQPQGLWAAFREGIAYMRKDRALFRLALMLGVANFTAALWMTILVLFTQDILGLNAAQHGLILAAAAIGAATGSLIAARVTQRFGVQTCLYGAIFGWAACYTVMGITSSPWVLGAAQALSMVAAMVWNVITVSWRQRRIPSALLGRVNSIYRFFGWGSIPLGALAAGALVKALEADLGRDYALRTPFLVAGALCFLLLIYAVLKLRLDDPSPVSDGS